MNITLALLPDFALILTGFVLRRVLHLGDHFWAALEKLVYFVLFPALLFFAMVRTPIHWGTAWPLVGTGVAVIGVGMILGWVARWVFVLPTAIWAPQFQCAFRFNSYIGLAVAGNLYGTPGITSMGLLIGATVPLANIGAVWALAHHNNAKVWREVVRNPLVLSTILGLVWSYYALPTPLVAMKYLGRLADASITLGLLAVGAALQIRGSIGQGKRMTAAWFISVKLLVLPAAALLMVSLWHMTGVYRGVAIIYAALPVASSAYILAQRMGADGARVAWLISVTTLIAMFTLPAWMSVVQ